MAVTAFFYKHAFQLILDGEWKWAQGPVKCMLLDDHVEDLTNDDYVDDVDGDEISGTGYTAGGKALTTCNISIAAGVIAFTADPIEWMASAFTADSCVFYYDTGDPTTSPLIIHVDFDGDQTSLGGTFTLTPNASGIGTVTPA